MIIRELIEQHRELLITMHRNGVSTDAARWLPVYNDYCELVAQGNKKTWAAEEVARRHGYRERWVRAIVAFMEEEII